jgi:purine-binding chemotaxis protein CheW
MTQTIDKRADGRSAGGSAGKYLTFKLSSESYGIPVLQVREIIRMTDITAVPQMPDYIQGVINLRGKIIPVIDLRLRFNLGKSEDTERTCIVVVQLTTAAHASAQIGFIVDAVEEVAHVAATEIEETPDFGVALATECITGMAKVNGKVKTLLDIDHIVSGEALTGIEPTAA